MAGSPLRESRLCQYENSTDHNFIPDRHPEAENVWRIVFELRHYHGLHLRTVAGILMMTEGTVKNTLFRATHKLRLELSRLWRAKETRASSQRSAPMR
jgi:RNA polymerase sigma-70 factor (ECF subfamily)